MSKPYTENDLSSIFDADLTWRRKELSDMKAAVSRADTTARPALLRAITAMSYAHWEGYVRSCATRYFEFLTLRRKPFVELERQIYINAFMARLDALHRCRASLEQRCELVNDILDGRQKRFSYVNEDLIDTRSNLNSEVMRDICLICGVDPEYFTQHRLFIDVVLLKRRNAIAHGQDEYVGADEVNGLVAEILALMGAFRNLLENKIYTKAYAA